MSLHLRGVKIPALSHPRKRCKLLLPRARHGWLVQELSADVLAQAGRVGVQQLCPRANVLTRRAVEEARRHGHTVRAWGVKSLDVRGRGWDTRLAGVYVCGSLR